VATADVDWVLVRRELAKPTGMPVAISQPDEVMLLDANVDDMGAQVAVQR